MLNSINIKIMANEILNLLKVFCVERLPNMFQFALAFNLGQRMWHMV